MNELNTTSECHWNNKFFWFNTAFSLKMLQFVSLWGQWFCWPIVQVSTFPPRRVCITTAIVPVPIGLDHVGTLFPDHNDWGIGVAADNFWHDAGVNHTKTTNTVNFEFVVDHRFRIVYMKNVRGCVITDHNGVWKKLSDFTWWTHFCCTRVVIDGSCVLPAYTSPVLIRP